MSIGIRASNLSTGPTSDPLMGISGIKRLPRARCYVTSTGIATLDDHIGSGITVGGITLIESDFGERFSTLVARHFIAQGVTWNHNTVLISDMNIDLVMKKLPALIPQSDGSIGLDDGHNPRDLGHNDPMQIAWRYQDKSDLDMQLQSRKTSIASRFDLAKKMDIQGEYMATHFESFSLSDHSERNESLCQEILQHLEQYLFKCQSVLKPSEDSSTPVDVNKVRRRKQMTRIVITGLYPTYVDDIGLLKRFFFHLKRLVRGCAATVMFLLPPYSLQELSDLSWFRYVSDYAIHLDAFATAQNAECNPAYTEEYKGLVDIIRLPVATLGGGLEPICRPSTLNLAFKIKRRQFLVEPLFIPPNLSETVSRSTTAEPLLQKSSMSDIRSNSRPSGIDF